MTKLISGPGGHLNVSRRRVLQGATALGATALVGPLAAGRASAQPKRGGRFRLAMGHGATSDSYDPATWD